MIRFLQGGGDAYDCINSAPFGTVLCRILYTRIHWNTAVYSANPTLDINGTLIYNASNETGNPSRICESEDIKMTNRLWHEGAILVPTQDGKTIVHYWAKVYDEDSPFGISGGHISKLMLKANGEIIYNYDRGEDIFPQTEAAEIALAILMKEYS